MTDEKFKDLVLRVNTAKKLKNELRNTQDIISLITCKDYHNDQAYRIGNAVLNWIADSEDEYVAFLNFVTNHKNQIEEALENL